MHNAHFKMLGANRAKHFLYSNVCQKPRGLWGKPQDFFDRMNRDLQELQETPVFLVKFLSLLSFSTDIKEELIAHTGKARHCQLAGLSVIFRMECYLEKDPESHDLTLFIQTDNVFSVRKCFTILKKAFNIDTDILETERELHANGRYY